MDDPNAMPAEQAPDQATEQAGYTICIKVDPAAGMTVSVETPDQEMAEGEMGEPAGMPAESIDDALDIARQIHEANGQMPKGTGMTPEQAFSDSFNGSVA